MSLNAWWESLNSSLNKEPRRSKHLRPNGQGWDGSAADKVVTKPWGRGFDFNHCQLIQENHYIHTGKNKSYQHRLCHNEVKIGPVREWCLLISCLNGDHILVPGQLVRLLLLLVGLGGSSSTSHPSDGVAPSVLDRDGSDTTDLQLQLKPKTRSLVTLEKNNSRRFDQNRIL